MSMNNVCQSVYVSALFFVPGLTFSQVSDLLRSETVEKVTKVRVRVQKAIRILENVTFLRAAITHLRL